MTPSNAGAWRARILLIIAVQGAIVAAYFATFSDMVQIWWTSSTFNHCFLIVPIALYLVHENRARLAPLAPGIAPLALLYLAGNGVLWTLGELVDIAFFQHLGAVGMLIGSAWLLVGPQAARILAFPLFYLYFAVPEGEFLVPYLQDWTAEVLVVMLRMTDIPVFIEGRYLSIPSGNFVVAEACSGINYLIATISVSSMYAYLRYRSNWRRFFFMLLAVAVPLLANGMRAYGIVMISDLSNYRYAQGIDHFIYGWVFFGIVIFALFALGNLFAESGTPAAKPSPPQPAAGTVRRALAPALIAGLVIMLAPPLAVSALDSPGADAPPVALPALAGWNVQPVASMLGGNFAGATQVLSGHYVPTDGTPEAQEVWLELHYFAREVPGQEVINQTNTVFDGDEFRQIGYGLASAAADAGINEVNELRLRRGQQEYLAWYWYDIGGLQVATRIKAKLAQGAARFGRGSHGSAAVIVVTPLEDGDAARARLREFITGADPRVDQLHVSP